MKAIKILIFLVILAVIAAMAYAYSGVYNIAVGTGHYAPTEWFIETFRERSIEVRAEDVEVPNDLNSPVRTQAGAGHYKDMCAGCHGFPGQPPTTVFEPRPPALYSHAEEPAEAFWIIRNGIKASAMPRHEDHSDEDIWNIVAFLQKLPSLTPAEYQTITAGAEHTHADGGGHEHNGEPGEAAASDEPASAGAMEINNHSHAAPTTAAAVLDAFHHALHEGDAEAALALLHENATILEGGNVQTKQQYAQAHLAQDIAFLSTVEMQALTHDQTLSENQAVISSSARIDGMFKGEEVHAIVSETATLVQTPAGWRIIQIVWTSTPVEEEPTAELN